MTRKHWALAPVIVALLAIGGFSSAASAAQFHSGSANTVITGSQVKTITFGAGAAEVTCSTATFVGVQSGKTAESLTLTPTSTGCHLVYLFTFSASPNYGSCSYVLGAAGALTVECEEEGDKIVIPAAGCTIEIPEQTVEGAVSYTEQGFGIRATFNTESIAYTTSGSTCGSAEAEDGTLTGAALLVGKDAGSGEELPIYWG